MWLQARRLERLGNAWQEMAARHDWLYVPSRGPAWDRDNVRVMIPSDYGAIALTWHAGYRGSTATTRIGSLAKSVSDFSIHLRDKHNPERVYSPVETGDPEYAALYQASSTRPEELLRALDADFRREHLASQAEFECCDEVLTLEVPGLIDEDATVMRLLALNLGLLNRLTGRFDDRTRGEERA